MDDIALAIVICCILFIGEPDMYDLIMKALEKAAAQ